MVPLEAVQAMVRLQKVELDSMVLFDRMVQRAPWKMIQQELARFGNMVLYELMVSDEKADFCEGERLVVSWDMEEVGTNCFLMVGDCPEEVEHFLDSASPE